MKNISKMHSLMYVYICIYIFIIIILKPSSRKGIVCPYLFIHTHIYMCTYIMIMFIFTNCPLKLRDSGSLREWSGKESCFHCIFLSTFLTFTSYIHYLFQKINRGNKYLIVNNSTMTSNKGVKENFSLICWPLTGMEAFR